MSGIETGAVLGAVAGLGLLMIVRRLGDRRRAAFEWRVRRPLADMPELGMTPGSGGGQGSFRLVFGPVLQQAAGSLERLVGGATSVRRRIERAGLDLTVQQFRVEQVLWGTIGFAAGGVLAIMAAVRAPDRLVPLAILALVAAATGVLARDNRLTAQVRSHEEQVVAELPAVAELLALSVAAGLGPVTALGRVVERSRGALSRDLARVLGDIRTGTPVAAAFDGFANRSGVPVVARFASGIAVAVERGTPLADVLHAQAGDVREAQRRALIESGARREVAMMLPVVFLVLPTTILFAFWPGVVGLRMVTS